MTPVPPSPKTIFQRAANDGIAVGILLTAFCVIPNLSVSPGWSVLLLSGTLLSLVFLLSYPYRALRRGYARDGFGSRFSDLWSQGIAAFALGGLIHALAIYIVLRFVAPDFIVSRLDMAIDIFNSSSDPVFEDWAGVLQKMKSSGMIPTAAEVSAEMITLDVFSGSCLSLVSSAAVKIIYSSPERRRRLLEKVTPESMS